MHKFQIYQNTYMKYNHKKSGNILFNFMFKLDRLNIKDSQALQDHNPNYYIYFSKKERLQTYKEDYNLKLIYNNIENVLLNKSNQASQKENLFASIKDMNVMELSEEIKTHVSLDRLIEIITLDCLKYDFYNILNKINDFLNKKEFTDEKLNLFKEKLNYLFKDIVDNFNNIDNIVIPFFYHIMIKTFFKVHKIPNSKDKDKMKRSNSGRNLGGSDTNNSNISSNNSSSTKSSSKNNANQSQNVEAFSAKNIEYLKNIFQNSFSFIKPELPREVSLSALNFMLKNIEENYQIRIEGKKKLHSEEFFINYITKNKLYYNLCDLLMYMSENPACAYPVTFILLKVIKKSPKEDLKEIISFIKQDGFKEVFKVMLKVHDCNGLIMTNITSILNSSLEFFEVEELFQIINFQKLRDIFSSFSLNGFDNLHESIILLIKAILLKKSSIVNTSIIASNHNTINLNSTNANDNQVQEKTNSNLEDKDYSDIVLIFVYAVNVIHIKLMMLDFMRIAKGLYNILTHLYTICNIINNINEKNSRSAHELCIDKKIQNSIIDCLSCLNEKKIFSAIDNGLDKYETNSINTKMIIFRTVYHSITLVQMLNDINTSVMVRLLKFEI